jgi:hypothetical protein
MALANAWWEIAQKQTAIAKAKFEARARHWYRQALADLGGLEKVQAERRFLSSLGAPDDAVYFAGHAYAVNLSKITWHEARLLCELNGGHLACIESLAEQEFLLGLANRRQFFIGATDEQEKGKWHWINGSPFEFTVWWPGQPDNTDGIEHYLALEPNGKWNDRPARAGDGGYICEWE